MTKLIERNDREKGATDATSDVSTRGTAGRVVDGQAVIPSIIKDCTWLKSGAYL